MALKYVRTEEDKAYSRRLEQKTETLKPLLTPELLAVLLEAVKINGWSGDFCETSSFVQWCHDIAGVDLADFEPYDFAFSVGDAEDRTEA